MNGRVLRSGAATLAGLALLVTGCSGSGPGRAAAPTAATTGSPASAAPTTTAGSAPAAATTAGEQLYVSLGDSYAAGYQPSPSGPGGTTRNGFAYKVSEAAVAKGYTLKLVNFGCGGATVESILRTPGCNQLGPDGVAYPNEPQAAAAERFIADNKARVALITVVIGGNDVTKCALAADVTACVTTAVQQIKADLTTLTRDLRAAAGPEVQIVGLTYPDVVLGAYVMGNPDAQNLAKLSIPAFKALINPALADTYAAVGATFVDVTAATGAYGSFDETTTLAPYGVIPVPVARVCQLTFFCDRRDIHPKTEGYTLIRDLVVQALKAR